jgi:hypothetical protein
MDIVSRAKNIILSPNSEWPVIAFESTDVRSLFVGYAMPLAAIPAVAGFIGQTLVGSIIRLPIGTGLAMAILSYVLSLVVVFAIGFVISKLAPQFGGTENLIGGLKVSIYSSTAGWVAGILAILPAIGALVLLASLYGLYLLYLGLPAVMGTPKDKSFVYTVVIVVVAIVVSIVSGAVVTSMFAGAIYSAAMH